MSGDRARRLRLASEQNHRCCYCGSAFVYDRGNAYPLAPTIDHIETVGNGGLRVWANEAAACWACNNGRGDEDATTYFAIVQDDIAAGRGTPPERLLIELTTKRKLRRPRVAARRPSAPAVHVPLTAKVIEYFVLTHGPAKAAEVIEVHGGEIPFAELSHETVERLTPYGPKGIFHRKGRRGKARGIAAQVRMVGHDVTLGSHDEATLTKIAEGTATDGALTSLLSPDTVERIREMRQTWKTAPPEGYGSRAWRDLQRDAPAPGPEVEAE